MGNLEDSPTSPDPPQAVADVNFGPSVLDDRSLTNLIDQLEDERASASADPFDADDPHEQLTSFADENPENAYESIMTYREAALDYLRDVQEFRGAVRPYSCRTIEELPQWATRLTGSSWVYYTRYDLDEIAGQDDETSPKESLNHDVPVEEAEVKKRGKYLFFSPDARVLETIAIEQLSERPFDSAKIPSRPNRRNQDFVLCVYSGDDRYKKILLDEYGGWPGVKVRGYKTNSATRRGDYSSEFLQNVDEEER